MGDRGDLDLLIGRLTRRQLLRGAALGTAGLVAAALIGCGDDDDDDDDDDAASGTAAATGTSEAAMTLPGGVLPINMENPRYGGTYRAMSSQATASFDVAAVSTGGTNYTLNTVYEKLFRFEGSFTDRTTEVKPELAESFEASEDLLTYTIRLKEGIPWQNVAPVSGREFDSSDVAYTYEQYMAPESILFGWWKQVESVETPDSQTVVLHLNEPSAIFIEDVNGAAKSYIFPRELTDRRTTAIGTGPFIVESFVGGTGVGAGAEEVRNPDYWRKDPFGNTLPYVDRYEYLSNAEIASKIAGLRAGTLNQADGLSDEDWKNLQGTNPDAIRVEAQPATYGAFSVSFKTEKPPWDDIRVRGAVSTAIDRLKWSQTVFGRDGVLAGPVLWSLISNDELTEAELGPYYSYDPEEAVQLLSAAGFDESNPLKATRRYGHAGDSTTAENAVLQQLLAEVGIEMEIDRVDYSTYAAGVYKRDWDDWGAGFGGAQGVADIPTKFGASGRTNFGLIGTLAEGGVDAVEAKIAELKVTVEPQAQRELLRYFWDLFVNQVPEAIPRGQTVNLSTPTYTSNVRNVFSRNRITAAFLSDSVWSRFPWLSDAPRTSP